MPCEETPPIRNIIPLGLFSVVVYLVFLLRHLMQRRSLIEHGIFTVFFIYTVGLLSVTFFPIPVQRSLMVARQHQPLQSDVAWNPIYSLYRILTRDHLHDIVHTIGGNLILLFPLGCLLPLMSTAITTRKALIWGLSIPIGIEALQVHP